MIIMSRHITVALLSLYATVANAQDQPASNPPPQAGLFEAAAGKWAWEGTTCSDAAHTLSFSADHKYLTYTSGKSYVSATGKTTSSSLYQVLYAEGNKIAVHLEGETRRTAAGDRVIWVFVLQDPNTYVWRRTDWAANASTKKIMRCTQ